MKSETVPQGPAALTVGDVFPFRGDHERDRKPLCRVRCDNRLAAEYRVCNRVLVVGEFKPNGEGRFELRFVGFPAGPKRELDRLGISEIAAARRNRSRPFLEVLDRDEGSVTMRCKCGEKRRIEYARVEELFLEKLLGGTSLPVVILTSELDDA
jgi:hypothetical protein